MSKIPASKVLNYLFEFQNTRSADSGNMFFLDWCFHLFFIVLTFEKVMVNIIRYLLISLNFYLHSYY